MSKKDLESVATSTDQSEIAGKIFAEYEKGRSFNNGIDLYTRVKTNNDYFLGKQWEGVNAPSFDKPVFNFIKRVCNYFMAMMVADDFAVAISPFFPDEANKQKATILEKECAKIFERTSFKNVLNHDFLRNCCIEGDAYFVMEFDPTTDIGQTARGSIKIDVVDSTNVMFGNPFDAEVQEQPYILIIERRNIDSLKNELKLTGISYDDDELVADGHSDSQFSDSGNTENDLITVIHKYYRVGETIHYIRVTQKLVLTAPIDLEYKRYPISSMLWEKVKGCYHGWSSCDGLIPNQDATNKMMAAALATVRNNAFPTTVYNKSAFGGVKPQFSPNKVLGVDGGVDDINKAVTTIKGGDMSAQVMPLVDRFTNMTKELMGASDTALGNINPDNTSAIIAVQRATAAPLDLQIKGYRQAIEGVVRSLVDIIVSRYGIREVWDEEQQIRIAIDFTVMADLAADINVDIGAGAYFSELLQIQTLDNLMSRNLIPDPVDYIKAIPDHMIKNKSSLIKQIEERQEMQAEMQSNAQANVNPEMLVSNEAASVAGIMEG